MKFRDTSITFSTMFFLRVLNNKAMRTNVIQGHWKLGSLEKSVKIWLIFIGTLAENPREGIEANVESQNDEDSLFNIDLVTQKNRQGRSHVYDEEVYQRLYQSYAGSPEKAIFFFDPLYKSNHALAISVSSQLFSRDATT